MTAVGNDAFRIISASMVCGILMSVVGSSGVRDVLRMLMGVFAAVVLLSGVRELSVTDFLERIRAECSDGQSYTQMGQDYAREQYGQIIKANCEAYVWNKAKQLNADITVDITLSDGDHPIPVGITITGTADPEKKQQLSDFLSREMGIPPEEQIWIG